MESLAAGQGASDLLLPRPALGKMQGQPARRAGEPSGHREEAPPEGLGGYHLLAQTDAHGPAGQVVGHHLDGQPGAVGGEASRGEMVEADAVLQVSDGILDLGVAAMVGLQFQHLTVPVGENWNESANWLSDAPLGEWAGVTTNDDGRVVILDLYNYTLSGELSAELGSLSNLENLNLGGNELSGEIPAELGSLSNLTELYLNDTDLSGCVPSSLEDQLIPDYFDLGDLPFC